MTFCLNASMAALVLSLLLLAMAGHSSKNFHSSFRFLGISLVSLTVRVSSLLALVRKWVLVVVIKSLDSRVLLFLSVLPLINRLKVTICTSYFLLTFRLYFLVAFLLNNKKRFQDLFVLVSFFNLLIIFFKVFSSLEKFTNL